MITHAHANAHVDVRAHAHLDVHARAHAHLHVHVRVHVCARYARVGRARYMHAVHTRHAGMVVHAVRARVQSRAADTRAGLPVGGAAACRGQRHERAAHFKHLAVLSKDAVSS